MQAGTGFELAAEPLKALLEQLHDGRLQIPEFQRPVRVNDEWVKGLLASVSLGYPVGAVMLLEGSYSHLGFATSPVRGAPPVASPELPERLLVDGQHRMAALYQALRSGGAVSLSEGAGRTTSRSYYIDMRKATDPAADRDDAIVSVADEFRGRAEAAHPAGASDLADCLFPLELVFGPEAERGRWLTDYVGRESTGDESRPGLVREFEANVLLKFDNYAVPTILFPKEWTRWTVRMRGGSKGKALSDKLRLLRRGELS